MTSEDEAKAAARVVLKAFEDGLFCRNTEGDGQSGYVMKFLRPISALATLTRWCEPADA